MFDKLSNGFSHLLKNLSGKGTISEKNIESALEDVKNQLIEADVNVRVVRRLISRVREEALGVKVLGSLSPYEQFIKIVNDKLVTLLGEGETELNLRNPSEVSVILMLGLQGVGKTTSSAKLASFLKKKGRKPLLVACDLVRPAAREQLKILGQQIDVPVYSPEGQTDTAKIAKEALKEAKAHMCNVVIIDTAGRLEIDESLMDELAKLKKAVNPDESLLVVDAMMGQNALNVAQSFEEKIGFSGVIVSKADSDTRGGVILSLKEMTGKPVKFLGVGEKIDELEAFFPERAASRILGMGDIVSLAEKAQEVFDEKEAEKAQEKFLKGEFTLEDYLAQIQSLTKLGGMKSVLSFLPGMGSLNLEGKIDENMFKQEEAIIQSMTLRERREPFILGPSRRKRIAKGSGTTVRDIARLLKRFDQIRNMMKKIAKDKNSQKQLLSMIGKQT